MIDLQHVCKYYTDHHQTVKAVEDVSFSVASGERLGIAGGSGCGKSTLLRLMAMLERPTTGTMRLFGRDTAEIPDSERYEIYRSLQMMFQNPLAIIPPRMKLGDFLREPYVNYGLASGQAVDDSVRAWLEHVDLPTDMIHKFPHEVSGGQLQRVVLARIMSMQPDLVLFDEPTSALDAVNQKLVLDLLRRLYEERPFGYIFVSHDIGLLQAVTDRILVMKDGRVVEDLPSSRLKEGEHPYTQALVEASV